MEKIQSAIAKARATREGRLPEDAGGEGAEGRAKVPQATAGGVPCTDI